MKLRRIFTLLAGLGMFAATVPAAKALVLGKYAGEFMAVGVGGRPLGMGSAYVAVANDVWAGYWNPAGLTALTYPEISIMHGERFAGVVNYDYAGVAIPYGSDATFAISFTRVGVDDIPYTAVRNKDLKVLDVYEGENGELIRNLPYVDHTFSDAEMALYLSFARRRSERLSWGANAKLVHKGFDKYSAWGLGFDLAVQGQLWGDLRFGANLQDVTTTLLSWNTGRRELIAPTLKLGLGWMWQAPWLGIEVLPVADVDVRWEGRKLAAQWSLGRMSLDSHVGAEFSIRHAVALRVGSDFGHLTLGAGLRLPRLYIDYAFMDHEDLGGTHRISLRLRLEEARFARKTSAAGE